MAILLFKLTQVPEDETQEIRQLLAENDIHFYETDAGFWRVGLDAIWLADGQQEEQARLLIADYQQARTASQRENYAQLCARGAAPSLLQKVVQQPFRCAGILLAVLFVLGLTLVPFLLLG
jgi:hypothetical protein